MKTIPLIALAAFCLTSCDVKVDNSDPPGKTTVVSPEKKTENNTTIVNPPKEEKKVENNTTIINPTPPKVEKKVETNTTIINPPKP